MHFCFRSFHTPPQLCVLTEPCRVHITDFHRLPRIECIALSCTQPQYCGSLFSKVPARLGSSRVHAGIHRHSIPEHLTLDVGRDISSLRAVILISSCSSCPFVRRIATLPRESRVLFVEIHLETYDYTCTHEYRWMMILNVSKNGTNESVLYRRKET